MNKSDLFELGKQHIASWCALNGVEMPRIVTHVGRPTFGTCAYYRDNQIDIWVDSCAAIGLVGRQWSYPGYVVDRTPYGVLAHELGHHSDKQSGARGGYRSHVWRPLDAKPLTGYCPDNDDNEWYAELFRLFVTNPDLFQAIRPKIEDLFFKEWPQRAESRPWGDILSASPRHVAAAKNKILKAS